MSRDTGRYLTEIILSFLVVCVVVCGVIGIRCQSYQEERKRTAMILESENAAQDIFRILKGEGGLSDKKADSILDGYGYVQPEDSAAGRQFLRDCRTVILGGLIIWIGTACILGLERYRKKKENDRQTQDIVEQLEKIREGKYSRSLKAGDEELTDRNRKRILDSLDSLGSYVELIRDQAHQEKEETKSLVTDLSHQLKTPVAALTSCYQILKNTDLSNEEREEFRTRMEQQLGSLEQLISALINISRMETGMIELQFREERIFETILEAVNRIWMKAQKKEIEIQLEPEDEIEDLVIRHDRKWLCEALINLLDNAVKYSPARTMITIRAAKMTSFLRLEIQDQGIGIPRENYHKVFQRFFRGQQKEIQNEEGAGVGLYLARRIIQGHHGMIYLDTRKMKKENGAVFVVQLPY